MSPLKRPIYDVTISLLPVYIRVCAISSGKKGSRLLPRAAKRNRGERGGARVPRNSIHRRLQSRLKRGPVTRQRRYLIIERRGRASVCRSRWHYSTHLRGKSVNMFPR